MKTSLQLTKQFVEDEISKAISKGQSHVSFLKTIYWSYGRGITQLHIVIPLFPLKL